jgi:hypothetical protein
MLAPPFADGTLSNPLAGCPGPDSLLDLWSV